MNSVKIFACLSILLSLSGCASHHVQKGALYGALTGAALGAGTGYLISEPDLLGPSNEGAGGDTSLPVGRSVLAGTAIGLVVGTIVGAMAGHGRDDGFEPRPKQPIPTPATSESQARAPYLRDL